MKRHPTTKRLNAFLCVVWLTLCARLPAGENQPAESAASSSEQRQYFETHIRPLLADHCYECHSTMSKKLQAGLRLDHRDGLLRGGDSGPAVDVADPDGSLLLSAIRYESLEMPPQQQLSAADIRHVEAWIRMGAPWPGNEVAHRESTTEAFDWRERKARHWSWQPIRDVTPPGDDSGWSHNGIDRFILRKLREQSLQPAGDADRRTLFRRVYFDLIGQPPTPATIHEFLADDSPTALERVVDRLLASESFAEKWARHWLDLVRFAEAYGHEFDYPIRHAWRYRSYLLRAIHADVSYDQLLREHIAGDLLSDPRRHPTDGFNESILGTAFWQFGEASHAPTDALGDRARRIDNQIDVACKSFLGLTVACARCHDHKFDPISTEDYYALVGILRSSRRQLAGLDYGGKIAETCDQLAEIQEDAGRQAMASLATKDLRWFVGHLPENDGDSATADIDLSDPFAIWRRLGGLGPAEFIPARDALMERVIHESIQAPPDDAFCDFTGDLQGWTVHGAAFTDDATNSEPLLRHLRSASRLLGPACGTLPRNIVSSRHRSERLHGVLRSPTFTFSKGVHVRVNSRDVDIRVVIEDNQMVPFSALLFEETRISGKATDTHGAFEWKHFDNRLHWGESAYLEFIDSGDGFFEVDEVRLGELSEVANRVRPSGFLADYLPEMRTAESSRDLANVYAQAFSEAIREWRTGNPNRWQSRMVDWLVREIADDAAMTAFRSQYDRIESSCPPPVYAIAMTEGDPEDCPLYIRGNHQRQGTSIPRRLPMAWAGESQPTIKKGSGRQQWIDDMLSDQNPLTARVAVNRLWHHLFGRGIVPSVDDFGVMGEPPSHPDLLDWLACDFRRQGWSMKRAIRQMVLSRTYQMSSAESPDAETLDPQNRWLHRMSVRRLPAESIRDEILCVAGSLRPSFAAESTPVHLTSFMDGRGKPKKSGPLDGDGHRSLYLKIRRNFLPPLLLAFDFPRPIGTIGRRTVSNVPAQALTMLNDPFVAQQAERWAVRLIDEHKDVRQRLVAMTETGLGRCPGESQLAQYESFLEEQSGLYELVPEPMPEQVSDVELRIWSDLCHALMNAKDFIFLR